MVSERMRDITDQCHYPELHLEDTGSVAVELMVSGARKQSYIWGYHRLARGLCGYFHLKIIARIKATEAPMVMIKLITQRVVLIALRNEADLHKKSDC